MPVPWRTGQTARSSRSRWAPWCDGTAAGTCWSRSMRHSSQWGASTGRTSSETIMRTPISRRRPSQNTRPSRPGRADDGSSAGASGAGDVTCDAASCADLERSGALRCAGRSSARTAAPRASPSSEYARPGRRSCRWARMSFTSMLSTPAQICASLRLLGFAADRGRVAVGRGGLLARGHRHAADDSALDAEPRRDVARWPNPSVPSNSATPAYVGPVCASVPQDLDEAVAEGGFRSRAGRWSAL